MVGGGSVLCDWGSTSSTPSIADDSLSLSSLSSELDTVVTSARADLRRGCGAALVEVLEALVVGRGGLKVGALRFAGAPLALGGIVPMEFRAY